jgi:DNA-binding NarL/FixJ family response regulator
VLDRAAAERSARRIVLGPLTREEAAALLPVALPAATRVALHEESGGNPFYLEQLARLHRDGRRAHAGIEPADRLGGVPEAVAVALADEVAPLSADARTLLHGAAVSGDPFEAGFAAVVADLSGARALAALDELLDAELLHGTATPRWFRFRHPLVRRAVYESAKTGWRLAAHARAADRLRAQAAAAPSQAHHVEQSASVGDGPAIELLARAADEVAPRAPATAARWLEAALRLVPEEGAGSARRAELLARLALALVATGRFDEGHATVLQALALCPPADPARTELIAGCAAIERLLGRFDDARTRLAAALVELPDPRSPAAVALRLELTAHASLSADFDLMRACAATARDDAAALGDAASVAAATAALSFADYSVGRFGEADARCREAAALVASLDDAALAARLETLIYLGWAEWFMGRFEPAGRQFGRGLEVSRLSGRAALAIELMVGKTLALSGSGQMAEALDLADAAVEEARLMGNDHTLVWALFALCTALEPAAGSASAVRAGEEAVAAARGFEGSTIAAGCGWALASALVAAGQGERAVAVMLEWQGGEDLPWFFPGHRAACYEVLTRAALLARRRGDAARWARRARDAADEALPFACAMADRAEAEVLLAGGEQRAAAELALASATTTAALAATVESARARILAGRALAAAGDRDGAAEQLRDAEAALSACGAARLQAEAVRELRKIGRRVNRRGRGGRGDSAGAAALSAREREVAELAAAGRTNREIAAELVLSDKTIESHLASVFVKLGVDARGSVEEALRAGEGSAGRSR